MKMFRRVLFLPLLLPALAIIPDIASARPERPELPPSTETAGPADIAAREAFAKTFPGRIIFDSNRGKGFGIHVSDALGVITPFVDTDRHEMYPDVSPDGKHVVFSSADSLNKRAHAEVWIADAIGANAKKLADNATFPTFSSDGKSVYFERARRLVMKIDILTRKEEEIFPKGNALWLQHEVVKPQVSPDGKKVAFISKHPRRWSSWFVDLASGEAVNVGGGCEPTWFPKSDKIGWISGRGAMERSGVSMYDLATKQVSIFHDTDAPRGHEYYPTITDDSRYLMYAAARPKEHSPTTANYQLFVKDLTTGAVTRITFDPYTNRWPKMFPKIN